MHICVNVCACKYCFSLELSRFFFEIEAIITYKNVMLDTKTRRNRIFLPTAGTINLRLIL